VDRRTFLKFAASVSAAGSLAVAPFAYALSAEPGNTARPNIIVIMVDDMGYSDIGCFGGEIDTPHLDRLAEQGLRLTRFYNTARCCPSRASLLTGLYPHQAGVGHMDTDLGAPSYRGRLKDDCITLAQALAGAGYRTVMAGKWHLGTGDGELPWQRGFQRFYGIPEAGGVYFWPSTLNRSVVRYEADEAAAPTTVEPSADWYSTDAFTDYAVEQIRQANTEKKPFFVYLPYVAPHFPHQAKEKDIQKYEGKYIKGWQAIRQKRYERQLELGIIDKTHTLTPLDKNVPEWDSLDNAQKKQLDRQMAVYAGIIDNLDQNIGKMLRTLRQTGQDENTLILFFSDNGNQEFPPLGSHKPADAVFGTRESFSRIALGWAHVSNTPFRRYKEQAHFGGTAGPFIARWPAAIADKGQLCRQISHIIDIAPTCLEAAGLDPTAMRHEDTVQKLPGVSLVPIFKKAQPPQPRTLFWEHAGNRGVLDGDWKLVAVHRGDWELYNIREDLTETHNLSRQYPDRIASLAARYNAWAKDCGVLPWPVKPLQRGAQ